MKIRKRLKSVYIKPKRKLAEMKPALEELQQNLKQVYGSADPLTDIVLFFDIMSRWHDRGVDDLIKAFEETNFGQHNEVIKDLRNLQRHFKNAGRNMSGWNRTRFGETVTPNKVFLGNILGLPIETVSHWISLKGLTRTGMMDYNIVENQARWFMVSHAKLMFPILSRIQQLT